MNLESVYASQQVIYFLSTLLTHGSLDPIIYKAFIADVITTATFPKHFASFSETLGYPKTLVREVFRVRIEIANLQNVAEGRQIAKWKMRFVSLEFAVKTPRRCGERG